MRRSSRDINIFSMSALDLFASALGAFMLLAVVFFPFFPNTGDDQGQVDKIKEQLAPAEAAAASAAEAAEDAKKEQAKAEAKAVGKQRELEKRKSKPIQFPDTDIVIALDTTGSMDGVVASLKAEIVSFTDLMTEWAPSVGIGFVDFKDQCQQPDPWRTFELREITPRNLSDLRGFVEQTQAGSDACNRDVEEAVGSAVATAINMPWRTKSKIRLLVVITDNAAYQNEVSATLARVEAFRDPDKGQLVAGVFVPSRTSGPTARDFLVRLSEAGGGAFVEGTGFTSSILLILGKI